MIPKPGVNRFAHQAGADLHVAQQDVVLTYALDLLRERGVLQRLAFKGGTYLRKMVLGNNGRFSEDLDFTALDGFPDDPRKLFADAFKAPRHGVQFELRSPGFTQNNFRATVAYKHEWDEGTFTLEVSYRERPFLPVEERALLEQLYFKDLPFKPTTIPCLQLPEALAEKLRATQQRASERDVYDIIEYARKGFKPDLVRLLAVGKLWNAHEAFDPDKLLQRLGEPRKDWPDLRRLLGKKDKTDWNAEAKKAATRFEFLRALTTLEKDVIADARRHNVEKELLAEIKKLAS
ncbi:MAG: nucleotidyl transferase AbiEii/AbiGii toxin family protein [Candidatus Thermoplasmatota archaeon]